MVTLTFVFNKNKIKKYGYTEDALLQPMREHAQKYGISEEKNGVFSKNGEDALCVLSMFIPEITHETPQYVGFLDEWTLDVDGEREDCIAATYRWFDKYEPHAAIEE